MRPIGPEAAKNYFLRLREGFFEKYLSGSNILDIGFQGGNPNAVPIVDKAIGVGLDYPGYDGIHLPFPEGSQDAVFASHCLEHIDNFETILADWYRVLRVGGYLLIVVPHRDLYERKSNLPSRFNKGHKRFYTSASLLAEIESSLPVGGYRITSLKEIDDGFDYSIPPDKHAAGSYEIELVVEKIPIPTYADQLREGILDTAERDLFMGMLVKAFECYKAGKHEELGLYQVLLSSLKLPYYPIVRSYLKDIKDKKSAILITEAEMQSILGPVIARSAFDKEWYLMRNPDVRAECDLRGENYAHMHYVARGYVEGREATGPKAS